jgi:CRP-like cAMP-binding protein
MIALLRYFRTIQPLSETLRDHLEDTLRQKIIEKKDFLLKAGQVCGNIYFVEKGLLRSYYTKDEKEISSGFSKEGDICVSIESFLSQHSSQEYIQALEDSIVYYFSHDDLQRIYRDFPEFNKISRVILEKCLVQFSQRMTAMWMQKSAERYDWFVRHYPDLPQRVPAKQLASFLGVTESMISKVKSNR